MPKSINPSWSVVKRRLARSGLFGLVGLVKDLWDLSAENRAFLAARFPSETAAEKPIEGYRSQIEKEFVLKADRDPYDFHRIRRTFRTYRKATDDLGGTLDLMLTAVEEAVGFTLEYGDIDETYYSNLMSIYDDVIMLLRSPVGNPLYPQFRDRLRNLVDCTSRFGWGVHDDMSDAVAKLEAARSVGTPKGEG